MAYHPPQRMTSRTVDNTQCGTDEYGSLELATSLALISKACYVGYLPNGRPRRKHQVILPGSRPDVVRPLQYAEGGDGRPTD